MAVTAAALPTVYEYYTSGGITAGLSDNQPYFTLNEKNITIYSGAFHYFRVPRAYWRDRLRKMRAAGLNTVETYIPWNLHEYHSGSYDFGEGGTDFEDVLHLEEFLKTAQEEDLLALIRPGPYICAEWEFGGLPSWILRETNSVRNSEDANYLSYVKRYFGVLMPILALLQFQLGGPIIGFQIENEYGNTGNTDTEYLLQLRQMYLDKGIVELLYTADSPSTGTRGGIPGVLQTANYNSDPTWQLDTLNSLQTNKPTMTMEYWTGWYDHWMEDHHTMNLTHFRELLEEILDYKPGSSVNMYMFVGSTNFGFLNGAGTVSSGLDNSGLQPTTSSYDYDAPLTEYGAYTDKYYAVQEVIAARNPVATLTPDMPEETLPVAYPTLKFEQRLLLSTLIDNDDFLVTQSPNPIAMEYLSISNNSGQSYGSIVYRKTNLDIPPGAELKITGYVRDVLLVLVNGVMISGTPTDKSSVDGFGFWRLENSTIILSDEGIEGATLDLVVENVGRNNYGSLDQFKQVKGLNQPIYLNDEAVTDWILKPLQGRKLEVLNMEGWEVASEGLANTPAFYRSTLVIEDDPADTFIDMRDWYKGIVFVNGFAVGRHFFLGPQQSLYIPGPYLVKGENDIIIYEMYGAPDSIKFSERPIFGGATHT